MRINWIFGVILLVISSGCTTEVAHDHVHVDVDDRYGTEAFREAEIKTSLGGHGIPGHAWKIENPVENTRTALERGAESYATHCARCHGKDGTGGGLINNLVMDPMPADLTDFHVQAYADGEIFWVISEGSPGTDMPVYKGTLGESEMWSLVHYIKDLD